MEKPENNYLPVLPQLAVHKETSKILDISFSNLSMKDTVYRIFQLIDGQPNPFHIITANPELVMQARQNDNLRKCLQEADMILPDGIGVVMASEMLGERLPERVAGYDLLHEILLFNKKRSKPLSLYLLGAEPNIIPFAVKRIEWMYPNVHICGYHHGYFEEGGMEERNVVNHIAVHQPDILLVGLGVPRQEIFINTYRKNLKAKIMIGVGGSFDVLAGKVKRAPQILQNLHLEWFYRLLTQPKRWRRQLTIPRFMYHLFRAKVRHK